MNPSMTVRLKSGTRYDAQNIQLLRKGWSGDYGQFVISFECSGVLSIFGVEDVAAIEVNVPVAQEVQS